MFAWALIPGAFVAGLLMFLAPCTLPMVPGYLAFIAAAPDARDNSAKERKSARRRILLNAFAFVLGFSLVFIALGASAGLIGSLLGPWRDALGRVAGAIIIIFGLTMLGILRIPALAQEKRFHLPRFITLGRPESSLLIGALFALGWSPCIGPILGSILLLASTSSTALAGALLLFIFSLGLGLPFVLTALLIGRAQSAFSRFARAAQILSYAGGVILLFIGALMLMGDMSLLVAWGFQFLNGPYSRLLNYM